MKKAKMSLPLLTSLFALLLCACNFFNDSEISSSSQESESTTSLEDSSLSTSDSESSSSEEIPKMSRKDAVDTLKSGPYLSKFTTDADLGLSNPAIVGIDQNRLHHEELYPVPTENVHVYSAKDDVGLYYGAINNAGTLSNFIDSIKNIDGIKVIEFEDITYDFRSTINLSNVKDLYLVGKANTLFLLYGWGSYITAQACENLHINNIQFDMAYSPTISGVISRVVDLGDTADITIDVPDEFDLTYQGYKNFDSSSSSNGQCSYMECILDSDTNRYFPNPRGNLFYNSATSFDHPGVLALQFNGQKLTIRLSKAFPACTYKTPALGTHVSFAFTMYQNFGLSFTVCNELYLENTNVYVTGGMGIHFSGGHNIYLNRANFQPKVGSQRIMTCTADIVHSVSVTGDLKITNSILEASHDDALNIKTWYSSINEVSKISSKLTIKTSSEKPDSIFEVGDIIELFDKSTLERIKQFEILTAEKSGTNYTVKVKGINGAKVTDDDVNYLVGNDTRTTHLYLHNCLIQNKRNRGILLQSRYSEISNCCFRNIIHGAIQVLGVRDYFGEAILPNDIVIKNNKFFNNYGNDIHVFSYGSSGQGVAGNIHTVAITNNFICNARDYAIRLLSTKDINVADNLIYAETTSERIMVLNTSDTVTFRHNRYLVLSGALPTSIIKVESGVTNLTREDNVSEYAN